MLTIDDWGVVSSVALCGEVEALAGVLRESAHEALECFPHVGSDTGGVVLSERHVWLGVCAACCSVLGANTVWELRDDAVLEVGRDWD